MDADHAARAPEEQQPSYPGVTLFGRRPSRRLPSSAAFRQYCTSSSTSSLASEIGLPWSSVSVCASGSRRDSTTSATRCSAPARSNGVRRAHASAARFAAPIASCASSRSPCATLADRLARRGRVGGERLACERARPTPVRRTSSLQTPRGLSSSDDDPHQVADRDDPHRLVALEPGQMPEAAVDHHGGRLARRLRDLDRLGIARHPRGDVRPSTPPVATARSTSRSVRIPETWSFGARARPPTPRSHIRSAASARGVVGSTTSKFRDITPPRLSSQST